MHGLKLYFALKSCWTIPYGRLVKALQIRDLTTSYVWSMWNEIFVVRNRFI